MTLIAPCMARAASIISGRNTSPLREPVADLPHARGHGVDQRLRFDSLVDGLSRKLGCLPDVAVTDCP